MSNVTRCAGALLLATVIWGGGTASVRACAVPVFRYALEHWPALPGEIAVFHPGPLTPEQRVWVNTLGQSNLVTVHTCDLGAGTPRDANGGPEWAALWQTMGRPSPPVVALLRRSPDSSLEVSWQAPFNAAAVQRLTASPERREVARRLLAGDSIVWLLLTSGDAKKDHAARTLLATSLRQADQDIRLPAEVNPNDATYDQSLASNIALRRHFSVVEVPGNGPEADLLRGTLHTLATNLTSGPVAVPVFGRARALSVLMADTLTQESILDVCGFLCGACSCMVKAMNPGVDLFVPIDWDAVITGTTPVDEILPPLVVPAATARLDEKRPFPHTPRADAPVRSRLHQGLWFALGLGLLVTVVATIRILR